MESESTAPETVDAYRATRWGKAGAHPLPARGDC
jgi:hypothetical protein